MAKITEKYEAIIVFSLKKDEEQIKALTAKFADLIKDNGTLDSIDEWGKKKLAYEINYEGEGYYVMYNFESKPDFPAELERVINITDGVLRSIVVLAQGK
ncbi:MAG: 30S ribosomal protein S6 [Oscillospiraceae bacterium]|nr:30S ribosomal protein S6 [Oscillospiraceae bacterium]